MIKLLIGLKQQPSNISTVAMGSCSKSFETTRWNWVLAQQADIYYIS